MGGVRRVIWEGTYYTKYEYQMDVMDYLWDSYEKGPHNITPAVDTEDIIQVNMDG